MKSKPEVFTTADISHVLDKVRRAAASYTNYEAFLVEVIKKVDPQNSGTVNFEKLTKAVHDLKLDLTHQEIYTILRTYEREDSWTINTKDFFVALGGKP